MINHYGYIQFEPPTVTKKQQRQHQWKRVAILNVNDDLTALYRWFLLRRFGLKLNTPIRGSHITFIADKMDIETPEYQNYLKQAEKYQNKQIEFQLDISKYRTDNMRWWFPVHSPTLLDIREAVGFEREPFFDLHLTIGNANEKNLNHSEYIKRMSIMYENN